MVRALVCSTLVILVACSSAPKAPAVQANPSLLDQKLLSDVVSAAFNRIDGLTLRRYVNGKNVAVQVSTTYPTETSIVRAHAAMLLTRAGAMRADLHRGGDLVAMVVLRAYGVQSAAVDDGNQQRGFVLGDLVLLRPGSGEVLREPIAAKAIDHYYSDGSRERRNVGRRRGETQASAPRAAEPAPEPMPAENIEPEPEPQAAPPQRERRRARQPERRARPTPKRRRAPSKKAKSDDKEDSASEGTTRKRKRTRRRRRRQPLILE